MKLTLPRVYPILDTHTLDARGVVLSVAAAAFLEGGARILQIRHKGHYGRDLFDETLQVAKLCAETGALLVIDDRADIAMLLDTGAGIGVHLGQDDLPPRAARKIIGSEIALGFSTHNASQLAAGGGEPVDYLALGPIFATASKQNPDPVVGIAELARCRPLVEQPLVAIGGITLENAADVLRAGADSVAIIGGLIPDDPSARSLRQQMELWVKECSA